MASSGTKRPFKTFAEANATYDPSSKHVSPSKRARSEPQSELPTDLWSIILKLPVDTRNSILLDACKSSPKLERRIMAAHQEMVDAEAALPAPTFDAYSKNCWYTMNKKYKRMKSSQVFKAMGDISGELGRARIDILSQAGPTTRYETRRNALEVLRRISKSIVLCEDPQIRREIMKDLITLREFAETMCEIARSLSKMERRRFKEEGFLQKLTNLEDEHGMEDDMEGLEELYEIFEGSLNEYGKADVVPSNSNPRGSKGASSGSGSTNVKKSLGTQASFSTSPVLSQQKKKVVSRCMKWRHDTQPFINKLLKDSSCSNKVRPSSEENFQRYIIATTELATLESKMEVGNQPDTIMKEVRDCPEATIRVLGTFPDGVAISDDIPLHKNPGFLAHDGLKGVLEQSDKDLLAYKLKPASYLAISQFPPDIAFQIASLLVIPDIACLSMVNKHFRSMLGEVVARNFTIDPLVRMYKSFLKHCIISIADTAFEMYQWFSSS